MQRANLPEFNAKIQCMMALIMRLCVISESKNCRKEIDV